jgi:hypothetical protein
VTVRKINLRISGSYLRYCTYIQGKFLRKLDVDVMLQEEVRTVCYCRGEILLFGIIVLALFLGPCILFCTMVLSNMNTLISDLKLNFSCKKMPLENKSS